jgi:hypothetical protein
LRCGIEKLLHPRLERVINKVKARDEKQGAQSKEGSEVELVSPRPGGSAVVCRHAAEVKTKELKEAAYGVARARTARSKIVDAEPPGANTVEISCSQVNVDLGLRSQFGKVWAQPWWGVRQRQTHPLLEQYLNARDRLKRVLDVESKRFR